MNDFKLKLILSGLAGVVFSFVFILLTFILPVKNDRDTFVAKPKGKLQIISQGLKNR